MTTQIIPLKIGVFGGQGSGKSTSAALIAAALSKELHGGAPVWVTDTEPGWQFLRPRIFVPEKIELVQRKVPTFKAMLEDIADAERAGACVWVADQLTVIWQELMESFKKKNGGFIPINVWGDLRQMWNEYVTAFRNSKMHMIAAGRLGNVMEEVEGNKPGQIDLVKTGTAFKAGGSESFGYEPDFLLELSLERKAKKRRGGQVAEGEGRMIHRADVLKDRTWALNGRVFRWADKPRYEPGGYRAMWDDLKPHFEAVQQTGEHAQLEAADSSEVMIEDDGRGDYYHKLRVKQACLEDWDATMELMFPGSAAAMKRMRAVIGEAITGVRSRTRLEQFDVSQLQQSVGILMSLERRLKAEPVVEEQALFQMLELAKEDFRGSSAQSKSLLEVLLKKSVEKINGKPAAQPAVAEPF